MVEQLRVLEHVHQVALVADRYAVGDVQDPAAPLVQPDDGVVHLVRPTPQHRFGQLIQLPLGQRQFGPLRDARGVRQLDFDQVAHFGPQAVQPR